MSGEIEISFVEGERLDEIGEPAKDFPDNGCFAPINVESRWHDNQLGAPLQGHEGRHGRADAKFTSFVVAGG
jgi:hypothetical protein